MSSDLEEMKGRAGLMEFYEEFDDRLRLLENPATAQITYAASPNMLPNSHPEWSTMAYTTASVTPSTVGDTNYDCYNWRYATAATTNLSGSSSSVLASGHSGYAGLNADAPIWDRVNGNFKLGSSTTNYDVCAPLPTNFVHPGQRFYIYFEASLAAADTDINDVEFYCGFWDDTAGQEKWIEGSAFTPTLSLWGSEGARTLEYKILAETDTGYQILSDAVSTAVAPASLSTANHVRLNFSGAPGFIRFVIYRKDGANYYRVGEIRNSIDVQFFDMIESGDTIVPVDGYPAITTSTPKAYAVTSGFEPGETGTFAIHTMTVQVPLQYDKSVTGNNQQYFRFGLTGLVASGSEREVIIRRIAVSEGSGTWSRSPRDMQALSSPSTSAASSPGPPGGGGTTTTPPGGGGGGPLCLTLDTEIDTPNGSRELQDIKARKHSVIWQGRALPVIATREGDVQFVWEIELEDGKSVRCSDTHRFIRGDGKPRSPRFLKIGDELCTREGKSKIIRLEQILGQTTVKMITIPYPHLFLSNGIVSHNAKDRTGEIPL